MGYAKVFLFYFCGVSLVKIDLETNIILHVQQLCRCWCD